MGGQQVEVFFLGSLSTRLDVSHSLWILAHSCKSAPDRAITSPECYSKIVNRAFDLFGDSLGESEHRASDVIFRDVRISAIQHAARVGAEASDALVARFCDRGFENHRCYPFAVVPPTMVAVGRPCGAIYQHQLSGVAALGLSCHSTDASAVSDSNFKRNSAAWHPPTTSFVSRVSFSHDLHICLRQHPEQQHLAAASGMDLPPYV